MVFLFVLFCVVCVCVFAAPLGVHGLGFGFQGLVFVGWVLEFSLRPFENIQGVFSLETRTLSLET